VRIVPIRLDNFRKRSSFTCNGFHAHAEFGVDYFLDHVLKYVDGIRLHLTVIAISCSCGSTKVFQLPVAPPG
jgi:hypothetical protein